MLDLRSMKKEGWFLSVKNLFHCPFPWPQPNMLSLAFAQRFSEFFPLSSRILPCFNQSSSVLCTGAEKVWNHCSNPDLTSWNILLAAQALSRGVLAMILTKLWAPKLSSYPQISGTVLYTQWECIQWIFVAWLLVWLIDWLLRWY